MVGLGMMAALLLAAGTPAADCQSDPAVTWQVEGGFATFRPESAGRGDALLDAIGRAGGRMRPGRSGAYDAIVASLVDSGGGAPPLYTQTWWDRSAERYELDEGTLKPDAIAIRARFDVTGGGQCSWSVDGVVSLQPCDGARLTLARGAGGVRGQISVQAANGKSAAACAAISERLIVGLGDSYASGEGNPDHPTRWGAVPAVANLPTVPAPPFDDSRHRDRLGLWDRDPRGPLAHTPAEADAQWWDNACHRSLLSQQALAAMAHAAADRHRRVIFLSFACSGATIFDGVVGPRIDAPGALRPDRSNQVSVALKQSQIEQLVGVLCQRRSSPTALTVPAAAPTWRTLVIRGRRSDGPRTLVVPSCADWRHAPDALLLSIGGNDIGFGGVGAWALLPDSGRLVVDVVPTINKVFGGGALKRGFGIVCPGRRKESRCRLNTDTLVKELPAMLGLLDAALEAAGLGSTPLKLQTGYPLVTHAEDGSLRGCLVSDPGGRHYELLNEPWLPAYATVLALPLRPDRLGRWSFGIQRSEMRLIDGQVLAPLNEAIAAHGMHSGWTVVPAARMPADHGICAADGELAQLLQSGADNARVEALAFKQFGWPRLAVDGWSADRPRPTDWDPYAVRARWMRTATDSALTQSVLDGGTAGHRRDQADRLGEALSGGIHPALALHAAMAEELAVELEEGGSTVLARAPLP